MATGTQILAKVPYYFNSVFFFIVLSYAESNSQLYDQEHAVLLNMKQYFHPFLDQWTPSNSSHCSWPGITCTGNTVTNLDFQGFDIDKTIPPFICDLKNLTFINFQYNCIPGQFPKSLYNCSKLEHLDLSQNYFVGLVPNDIDRLANLRFLSLSANKFSGDIPASIGRLKELRELQLYLCQFNGTIPDEIGNLSNLEVLDMAWNIILPPTKLPSSFTRLENLKTLWMYYTNLIGEIPKRIGGMTSLEDLDLSRNGLSGEIPSGLFTLKNLSVLYLFSNRLSGEIPVKIESLNLVVLDVSMNQLSGEIPESLAHLPALEEIVLSSNNLSGTLPPHLGRYSPLKTFQVESNRLAGELPESLGNCSSLNMLNLDNNNFSGKIPPGLWTLPNLETLKIDNNKFADELPQTLSGNLSYLSLSNNQFSGSIPAEASTWRNLNVFSASKNLLNGSIPREITTLSRLKTLLLDENQLTGPLPSEIISLESLTTLNLSHNQLSGQIPDSIDRLHVLVQLDLSNNQLSGRIPSEFENRLYSHSFLNNYGLCADTKELNLPLCHKRLSKRSFVILALIIGLVALACLAAFLMWRSIIKGDKTRKQELDTSWKLTSFQRLSFTETDIVSSMTDHNIIGRGGCGIVSQIAVNGLGYVAVKKILDNRKLEQRLKDAFLAELKILSNIRHNNIVKLLCCISNEASMLLVYEYLENHSLDQWLSKRNRPIHNVVLDWPKRLQIAIGAAQGLTYMHHDCFPPIVHRDIKTSNILLDSGFNAKVGDFGLARILIKPSELTMSAVAGSFGYIAPEYVKTLKINEKIDVYGFGVVLLELATGREATHGDEYSSLAEWAWRHVQSDGDVEEVLDEEIKAARYMDEIRGVFKLGLMCTATLPAHRPSMKEVLYILLRIREPSG